MKFIKTATLMAFLATSAVHAFAGPAAAGSEDNLAEHELTAPPIGYVQFCRTNTADCQLSGRGNGTVELTARAWSDLVAVNDEVNTQVKPITDAELFGIAEYWTYPVNQGDCEDYVLLKRKRLIERGWPANAVLVTVVRDQNGDGHAVLTVATSAGDLVLDNQDSEIRFWRETPYRYLKRQSHSDATRWVALQDDRRLTPPAVATTSR